MRLLKHPGFLRFLKYASVGISTLTFDLILLFIVIEGFGLPYLAAVPICFVIAVSLNYLLSRLHVFKGTERDFHAGYGYFLLSAGAGAFLTTSGVVFLIDVFGAHYLPARLGVAALVGIANYLFNLHVNFRVAGHHP